MRTFVRPCRLPVLMLCLALFSSGWSNPAQARPLDDDAAAKPASPLAGAANSTKPTEPSPTGGLTERERMLLDRVEQLERRVAELEAAHQPLATTAVSPATNS